MPLAAVLSEVESHYLPSNDSYSITSQLLQETPLKDSFLVFIQVFSSIYFFYRVLLIISLAINNRSFKFFVADEFKQQRKSLEEQLKELKDRITSINNLIPKQQAIIDEGGRQIRELTQKTVEIDREKTLLLYKLRKAQSKRDLLKAQVTQQEKENLHGQKG